MDWWGWVIVVFGVLVVLGVIITIIDNKKRKYTIENGTKTHGWLVQANSSLFEEGTMDLPALVIISPDEETNNDEDFMTELAEKIMELKGEKGDTKAERAVAKLMADETYISGRWDELPEKFTDGKKVFLVHIMIYRNDLPAKMLEDRKIPCAIVWDEPGTVVCTRPSSSKRRKRRDEDEDEDDEDEKPKRGKRRPRDDDDDEE